MVRRHSRCINHLGRHVWVVLRWGEWDVVQVSSFAGDKKVNEKGLIYQRTSTSFPPWDYSYIQGDPVFFDLRKKRVRSVDFGCQWNIWTASVTPKASEVEREGIKRPVRSLCTYYMCSNCTGPAPCNAPLHAEWALSSQYVLSML